MGTSCEGAVTILIEEKEGGYQKESKTIRIVPHTGLTKEQVATFKKVVHGKDRCTEQEGEKRGGSKSRVSRGQSSICRGKNTKKKKEKRVPIIAECEHTKSGKSWRPGRKGERCLAAQIFHFSFATVTAAKEKEKR